MQLNNDYQRDDFLKFLEEDFLTDFKKDVRSVNTSGLSSIQKANYLGESKSLDLQVFDFLFEGSPNKRVALTKDAFSVMRSSAIFKAIAIFHSPNNKDWRLSLMTATPEPTEKGKVSLSYSNPKRLSFFLGPNAKINTPTKFLISKGKIADFEDLKSRFSIEVVNKEFYKEISQAFTKLVSGLLKLPSAQDKNRTSLEFAVRLIGRIIFCWFLREKKSQAGKALMPKELLSLEAVKKNDDYYHKILEPIFFEILNKPVKSRWDDFTKEPFSSVPYLNGGLFSPQDDDYYERANGDLQSQYHNTLVIPDNWIKDFFEILETYNFTIDENTSYDEELSIDPEMLGRIFENLLAEINPETGESARKSTGSYYTPRVIVNYMVDESLLLYLKEQTGIKEEKLKAIINYDLDDDVENPVTPEDKEKIIDALEKVKILDPACGSGAFPIGALQKIVFILQQTDPDGQLWFKKQIKNTSPEIKRVVEREFAHKNFDYIRKLGIIRENIYGVDIQPIATEISRLRCFLTLIVDQRIQEDLENRGIEPLPNLDFKFVTANTLIGLPSTEKAETNKQVDMFDNYEKIDKLKSTRDAYFTSSGIEREQLKSEFHKLQKDLVYQLVQEHGFISLFKAELTNKLTEWDPFSHKASSWFDPEWMFGIKDGFDIVIANPPYVNAKILQKTQSEFRKLLKSKYRFLTDKWDLYIAFLERSLDISNPSSVVTMIIPTAFVKENYSKKLREYLIDQKIIHSVAFLDFKVFEAGVRNIITIISKNIHSEFRKVFFINEINYSVTKSDVKNIFKSNESPLLRLCDSKLHIRDVCFMSVGMVLNANEKLSNGEFIKKDLITDQKDEIHNKRYTEGKWINKYRISRIKYLEWNTERVPNKIRRPTFEELYKNNKILINKIGQLKAAYDETEIFCDQTIRVLVKWSDLKGVTNNSIDNSVTRYTDRKRFELETISDKFYLKYILSLLNSKLYAYLFDLVRTRESFDINPEVLQKLPILDIPEESQIKFVTLIDKILDSSSSEKEINDYEKQIDQMVYKLYELTPEEIAVVEGKNES